MKLRLQVFSAYQVLVARKEMHKAIDKKRLSIIKQLFSSLIEEKQPVVYENFSSEFQEKSPFHALLGFSSQ